MQELLLLIVVILIIWCFVMFFNALRKPWRIVAKRRKMRNARAITEWNREAAQTVENLAKTPGRDAPFVAAQIVQNTVYNGGRHHPAILRDIGAFYAAALAAPQVEEDEIPAGFILDHAVNFETQIGATIAGTSNKQREIVREIAANRAQRGPIAAIQPPQPQIANDMQNTHDSTVCEDIRRILNLLKIPSQDEVAKIITNINNATSRLSGENINNAQRALDRAFENTYISTYNLTEGQILAACWLRAASDDAKMAILESLADCVENGHVVCANGRAARYIGALAVDPDPTFSSVQTRDMIKAEIFENAALIIRNAAEAAKASDDLKMAEIGAIYLGESDEKPDAAAETAFKAIVIARIREMIAGYGDRLNEQTAANYAEQCIAGI